MENAATAASRVPELPVATVPVVSLRELGPWVLFALAMVALVYFVGYAPDQTVHEVLHDGRHLLGFPCH